MKKGLFRSLLFTAIVGATFVSCGGSDDTPIIPQSLTDPVTPVDPTPETAMTVEQQKEYLGEVAQEFMRLTPTSDFQSLADLYNYVRDTYGNSYDWSTVDEWSRTAYEAALEALGQTSKTEANPYMSMVMDRTVYNNYKAVIMASNFTGHFTARNGRWVRENANDLQFVFSGQNGSQCVLSVVTSGSVKKVHLLDAMTWTNWDYKYENNIYTVSDYYDRTALTVGIPQNINVTLTQGGSIVAKSVLNFNLDNITTEEFDLSRNSLTMSALLELSNGYNFNLSKIAYSANSNAALNFNVSKGAVSLISMSAASDIHDLPSINVSAFSGEEHIDAGNYKIENAFVKVDVLGKVQMQGTVSDVLKFSNYLEAADDNKYDENIYKSNISEANLLADVNLFYNGSAVKQATIKLEPFATEGYNWSWTEYQYLPATYWQSEPIICFYDGSSYSYFRAFFSEDNFGNTFNAFKALANQYATLVGTSIDW